MIDKKYTCLDKCAKKDIKKCYCNKYNKEIINGSKVEECVLGIIEYINRHKKSDT